MMFAMAGYVLNDTFMKFVLDDVPFFQALFIRGIFATLFMGLLCWQKGSFSASTTIAKSLKYKTVWIRVICEIGGTFFFLTALSHMPLASVTAVLQILPLVITLCAAWIFGEKVGWRRYFAIFSGFFGVMLILRPGTADFDIFAVYALIAVMFITIRDMTTRRMPKEIPTLLVSLLTAIAIFLASAVGMVFSITISPDLNQIALLAAAAGILCVGYTYSIAAMRVGDISFVTPFRYSILVFALLLGFFVFNDVPDIISIIGSLIVVGSGLFNFYRERVAAKNTVARSVQTS